MTDTQDILYIVLAIAALWVTVFLSWALYEIASLVRRANRIVDETTAKIARIERIAMVVKDKIENSVDYLGIIANGGRMLLRIFQDKEKQEGKRKKKSDLVDEE